VAANVALVDGDIGDRAHGRKDCGNCRIAIWPNSTCLVNNAGVFIPKPFTDTRRQDFNTLASTTLAGFLYVSQLAVKQNAAAVVRSYRQHLNDPG